eukprot:CAMPEP_0115857392 /NCGR_PEP_ID=MMETSP0287-20121206/15551_1 /TAXON_ID=412157 /ORGANISM="Chrysochromulina rotalis, Strain UIO044" /LENGTH=550 /DNA_ID=CAMNT_0003311609 /DNA_START=395 /DNA_END=2047 /DNA_ORIENTATION=-
MDDFQAAVVESVQAVADDECTLNVDTVALSPLPFSAFKFSAFNFSAFNTTGLEDFAVATRSAFEASWVAFAAWMRVIHLAAQFIGRLAVIAWPTVRSGAVYVVQRAASQSRQAIAIEIAILMASIVFWRFAAFVRRRSYVSRAREALEKRVERLVARVRRRSRLLAMALPHIFFVVCCVACAHMLARLGMHEQALVVVVSIEPWVTTGLPALRTLLRVSASPNEQRPCLEYWVVWASIELCKDLLHAIPFFPRLAMAVMPLLERWWPLVLLHEIPLCAYLWLQLPGRRGLRAAYDFVAPKLKERSSRMGDLLPAVPERIKGALLLALSLAVGSERSASLVEAVHEARLLLVGLFFLLTPTQIALIGLPLLALGGPILSSIEAISATKAPMASETLKAGRSVVREDAVSGTAKGVVGGASQQMQYWIWYALLWGGIRAFQPVLAWVPFVTHLQLLAVLWLQLPIFRAVTRLLTLLLPLVRAARQSRPSATNHAASDGSVMGIRQPRANAHYASGLTRRGTSSTPQAASDGTGGPDSDTARTSVCDKSNKTD